VAKQQLLLTDSRALYYLFSPRIAHSSVRVKKWCTKLIADYPYVRLHFVRTTENLADFLTCEGLPPGDCEKFNIKDVLISEVFEHLLKHDFTLLEWATFVEQNPQYLTINSSGVNSIRALTFSISRALSQVREIISPIDVLREKLARSEIIAQQKVEFPEIYAICLSSENFEYSLKDSKFKDGDEGIK
jgi:hypothetical protein